MAQFCGEPEVSTTRRTTTMPWIFRHGSTRKGGTLIHGILSIGAQPTDHARPAPCRTAAAPCRTLRPRGLIRGGGLLSFAFRASLWFRLFLTPCLLWLGRLGRGRFRGLHRRRLRLNDRDRFWRRRGRYDSRFQCRLCHGLNRRLQGAGILLHDWRTGCLSRSEFREGNAVDLLLRRLAAVR